ncbi:hypothetical protein FDECE_11450 [Fusarium decemcellulare]|nr:hypothetical protein FDECE_11450 [Fusarium decemcellulare]
MAKTRSSGDEKAKKMPNQGPAFAGVKKQTKTYAKRPRAKTQQTSKRPTSAIKKTQSSSKKNVKFSDQQPQAVDPPMWKDTIVVSPNPVVAQPS